MDATCRHCGRTIIHDARDGWVDPEATGDDVIWREGCDSHDSFAMDHEPDTDPRGFDDFATGYVTALLWASIIVTEEDGEPVPADEVFEPADVWKDRDVCHEVAVDLWAFFRDHAATWREAGWDDAQAGHDFLLTRDGHGAGFWDRGRGDAGDELTAACRPYGDGSDVLYELELPNLA